MSTINSAEILKTKLAIACRQIRLLTSYQNLPVVPHVNTLSAIDVAGYKPIHHAAVSGNNELATLLANLFHWFRINDAIDARDRTGSTSLHWAIRKGHGPVIQTLVDYGANVNAADFQGRTPLHLAVSAIEDCHTFDECRFCFDMIRFLIERGAVVNVSEENGSTPLHVASELGNEDVVSLLIENGASVDSQDNEGETPIFGAIRAQRTDVVKQLVQDFKADTLCQNSDGENPIEYARAIGDDFMARLLESMAGTRPEARAVRTTPQQSVPDDFGCQLSLSAGSRFSWENIVLSTNPLAC